jgi:hypothetical protein
MAAMKPTPDTIVPVLSAEEVLRRLGEYRQVGLHHKLPAQVVYQPPNDVCPWANCGFHVGGIRFNLDQLGDNAASARWLKAWWAGPGLIGPCPHCRRSVLFSLTAKEAVVGQPDVAALLPDDWYTKAHLVSSGPD